jgi:translation initiation factor IF-2
MNNGKVRIYELSKELNLDNKDIKDICDRLNISIKSHSSTITDEQATQVRELAANVSKKPSSASNSTSSSSEILDSSAMKAKEKPKQQILAIHNQNTSNRPNSKPAENPSVPVLTEPPKLIVTETNTDTSKPQSEQTSEIPTSPPKTLNVAPPNNREHVEKPPLKEVAKKPELKPVGNAIEEKKSVSARAEAPRLSGPPSRPKPPGQEGRSNQNTTQNAPKATKVGENQALIGRPVPKINRSNEEGSNKPRSDSFPRKDRSEPRENKEIKTAVVKGSLSANSPKLQGPPRRPPLNSPKDGFKDNYEDELELAEDNPNKKIEEAVEEDALPELIKPVRRPTPPTKKVTQGTWESGEEDANSKKAVGKAGVKNKRKSKMVIEDLEDDVDLDEEDNNEAEAVNVWSMRAAKPKSMVQQPTTTVTVKSVPKKPTSRGESRNRNDRRERQEVKGLPESIVLSDSLTIRELAELLNVAETEIVKQLFFKGVAVNITQTLDLNTARAVAEELGVIVETGEEVAAATKVTEMLDEDDLERLQRRPPVVTIMGHVDHGKTTLLDSIRKTKVAQGEAGGITQHIGAYHVDVEHEGETQQIVFLDTPGHEAFTAMRARGARVTDIAVLVVAADDGVQPQTKEAIGHARAAGVPIVVAINKVDKPESNPDRIMQELTEQGLLAEAWGGDTIMVPVSALKGENLDGLLEMLVLVSEMEELSANPDRPARGTVIEAHLDRTRGPVATLLVQNGTLRVGDVIVAGSVLGKIKAMIDDRGDRVEDATPSFAVEILGLGEVPAAGDEFEVYPSEKEARAVADARADNQRQSRLQQAMSSRRVTLGTLSEQAKEGELKELNLILKADVQGSVEAILGSLQQLPQKEVQIRVLLSNAGEVNETDVALAAASGAVIIGFNTALSSGSRQAADREGVDIRQYNIIYNLLDDIQGAMEGLLEPEEVEEPLGQAEVRNAIAIGRGFIAGCYILSGKVVRNSFIRVRRNDKVVFEGVMDSLKRFKEDAREVNAGYECGISSSKFNIWQEGDIIESYQKVMKRRTLTLK